MASLIEWAFSSGGAEQDNGEGSITALLLSNIIPICVVLYLTQVLYLLLFHPLSSVPGPFLARFSKSWRNIRYFRGSWLEDVVDLHERYGPIARIAPNEVSFVDENGLKQMYGHGKPSQKTSWYDTWVIPGMGISFFATTDAKLHRHIRSRVTAAYSMSSMLSFEPLIQQVLDANWTKFKELAQKGKPVDLSVVINYFTFDVVSQLALGGMLGFIEQQQDISNLIKSIHDGFYLMANMGDMPGQMWFFNNALAQWMTQTFGGRDANSLGVFLKWLDGKVEQRMKDGLEEEAPRDMLQHFIEAKNQEGKPVSKSEVMIEGVNILGAGADTTTVALLAVLGQTLCAPEVLKKLRAEVDAAYTKLKLPDGAEITFEDAARLPYLAAVVKESMRLHPSITYQLPRVPPEQGINIAGYFVPKTATCGISPASMNRSTELFGDDASSFNPDRWILTEDTEEEQKRLRIMEGNLTTFGMGSRSCVGKNLASVEVHKFMAQFIRHFDAELENKKKPWVTKSQWFSLQKEFWVTLKERN